MPDSKTSFYAAAISPDGRPGWHPGRLAAVHSRHCAGEKTAPWPPARRSLWAALASVAEAATT